MTRDLAARTRESEDGAESFEDGIHRGDGLVNAEEAGCGHGTASLLAILAFEGCE